MTTRRRVLLIVAILLSPLLAGAVWCVVVTLQARRDSPALLAKTRSDAPLTLPLSAMSPWQKDALLRVEDPSFYEHRGVDLHTPGQGLTTITQALVKWIYFEHFRPGVFNKIRQTLIAHYVLDPSLSKSAQLELFINRVYLGSMDGVPVHGLARAAEVYYGKPFAKLGETEYLSLVALINSPDGFHLRRRPAANAERVRRIQKLLSGEYEPKALRDMYYGPLDTETQSYLAPVSYQPSLY
jgi:membrane carboxypeptidase/penicillin-binding protein